MVSVSPTPAAGRVGDEAGREGLGIARAGIRTDHALRNQVAVAVVVDRDHLLGLARGALELGVVRARLLAAAVAGAERCRRCGARFGGRRALGERPRRVGATAGLIAL